MKIYIWDYMGIFHIPLQFLLCSGFDSWSDFKPSYICKYVLWFSLVLLDRMVRWLKQNIMLKHIETTNHRMFLSPLWLIQDFSRIIFSWTINTQTQLNSVSVDLYIYIYVFHFKATIMFCGGIRGGASKYRSSTLWAWRSRDSKICRAFFHQGCSPKYSEANSFIPGNLARIYMFTGIN